MTKPMMGEANIGMTTWLMMPHQYTTVPLMRPAPTMPPMRACEEDEGSPNHQVIRFQMQAPSRAARMMTRPFCCISGRGDSA